MVGNTNKRNETTGAQNSAKDNKPNKTVGNANKKNKMTGHQSKTTAVATSRWMMPTHDIDTTVPFKEWRLRQKTVKDTTADNNVGAGF